MGTHCPLTNRRVPQVSLLRPGIRATDLEWKPHSPLCHPERSRGICSSADPSWKCFSTERNGAECASFLPSHRSDALYQGTTLVGPFKYGHDEAFRP
jgi:hypothetical protein